MKLKIIVLLPVFALAMQAWAGGPLVRQGAKAAASAATKQGAAAGTNAALSKASANLAVHSVKAYVPVEKPIAKEEIQASNNMLRSLGERMMVGDPIELSMEKELFGVIEKLDKLSKAAKTVKPAEPAFLVNDKLKVPLSKAAFLSMDVGGTSIKGNIVINGKTVLKENVRIPTPGQGNAESYVDGLAAGFEQLRTAFNNMNKKGEYTLVAVTMTHPGPADYPSGTIGWTNNIPALQVKGGTQVGAMLSEKMGLPVHMYNDAGSFALGEFHSGSLAKINEELVAKNAAPMEHLIVRTLGTGLGGGAVVNGCLVKGDNGAAGEIWCQTFLPAPGREFAGASNFEEHLSARGLVNTYRATTRTATPENLTAYDIDLISKGAIPGDKEAALATFDRWVRSLGKSILNSVTDFDAAIVIGGGLANSFKGDAIGIARANALVAYLNERNTVHVFYNMQDPIQANMFYRSRQGSGIKERSIPVIITDIDTSVMAMEGVTQDYINTLFRK